MSKRDMTAPNWKRTVGRLRKLAAELARYDFQVTEPENLDTPPSKRLASGGIIKGSRMVIVGESGPELLDTFPPRRL